MMEQRRGTVLLTGATGFVGRHLVGPLRGAGWDVRAASRRPVGQPTAPGVSWVELDLDRSETIAPAMTGCRAAIYLVHGMGQAGDFEARERAAAEAFARAAEEAGVERIVYLGGVRPSGVESKHLRSRLQTGTILREAGSVTCVELRAGMIVGPGSASFTIVRDLAMRLPAMVLPRWLRCRSQPVAIRDVVAAVVAALDVAVGGATAFDLPGPETLTSKEVLLRMAALRGARPLTVDVPVLSPRLSSHWIRLVSRADYGLAASLVEGLTVDLVSERDDFERLLPGHVRQGFDEAAAEALADDAETLGVAARAFEGLVRWITPRLPPPPVDRARFARRALALGLGILGFAIAHPLTSDDGPWLPLGVAAVVVMAATPLLDPEQLRPPPLTSWLRRAAGGAALGVVMTLITLVLYTRIIPGQPGLREEVRFLYDWIQQPPGLSSMLAVLAITVAAEEVVFRGLAYRLCRDRWGDLAAVVLPTVGYALVHVGAASLLLILLAATCGLAWSLQRLFTGTLLGVFCTHLVWDVGILVLWPLETAAVAG